MAASSYQIARVGSLIDYVMQTKSGVLEGFRRYVNFTERDRLSFMLEIDSVRVDVCERECSCHSQTIPFIFRLKLTTDDAVRKLEPYEMTCLMASLQETFYRVLKDIKRGDKWVADCKLLAGASNIVCQSWNDLNMLPDAPITSSFKHLRKTSRRR